MTTERAAIVGLSAPAEVKASLEKVCLALEATGAVTGIVLYGGLARGRYAPHQSDVNVVVLLKDGAPSTLSAIAEPLRQSLPVGQG